MPRVYYQEATLDIVNMTNSLLDSGCCSTMIKSLPPPRLKSSTPTRISYFTIYDYLLLLCSSSVALPQHASIVNREAPIFFPPLLALAGRRSWHRNSTTWLLLEFHSGGRQRYLYLIASFSLGKQLEYRAKMVTQDIAW